MKSTIIAEIPFFTLVSTTCLHGSKGAKAIPKFIVLESEKLRDRREEEKTNQMPQNVIRSVGHHSLNGYGNGGQVVGQRRGNRYYAFVGHLRGKGTSIVDVTVPDKPELIVQTEVPENTHSHKVRLSGDIMLVNNERQFRISEGLVHVAGLRIFDTKDISSPREISFLPTGGLGVHRFFYRH